MARLYLSILRSSSDRPFFRRRAPVKVSRAASISPSPPGPTRSNSLLNPSCQPNSFIPIAGLDVLLPRLSGEDQKLGRRVANQLFVVVGHSIIPLHSRSRKSKRPIRKRFSLARFAFSRTWGSSAFNPAFRMGLASLAEKCICVS